ncbi:NAD-dependent deacetylase [Kibdelosporangium banguiense]|uniref:protein acetyllysine N-acetyltransferase n=1 Tax=Kibdelosporangium banguiense TaxID=1365924 RepID=A0ABS4TQG1_9PSEU|nr:Sir2 family NAD-dependent protein deacetylase [Kibdelosporangium banguiense]MBP2326153.1 NAD-dependent deacetylase [Kibdelosporangium banguiense]
MNEWARGVKRVAVLTGAGISTDSGIPDFRGPDGLWTKDPSLAEAFTYDRFMTDGEVRKRFWSTYSGHTAWVAEPNPAHRALAELDQSGVALRVLTQNIDGLHQRAGLADRKVLELHGSMHKAACTKCEATVTSADVIARVRAGEPDPPCAQCGGVLKLGIVLFGEYLDGDVLGQAEKIAAASQLFLAIGSSLEVEPAASMCAVAVAAGASLVIINRDPTPYDRIATEVIREPIGTAVPKVCAEIMAGSSG